ncbi:MAG: LLM class flavin-dependent oxidoreductase [Candidatus Acidiferrales bacterium]
MAKSASYRLSVLDLSPVASGSTSTDALRNTLDLARLADDLGYTRYWLAEHHNTQLIASSTPEVMIGHVASVTKRIRVGSGGVMLPNHAPLHVAEAFRVLEALHPGRIDLGLGRAPGTDSVTALALRRSRAALSAEDFPQRLDELLAFLDGGFPQNHPFESVRAMPDDVPPPDVWLLGSSDFSSALAAQLGLGFAFAHHINPLPAVRALREYQDRFQPSARMAKPQAIIGVSLVCAETDEKAELLARPLELTLLRFRQGRSARFPTVTEATEYPYTPEDREIIRYNRQRTFVGSPETVRARVSELAGQAGVEEIMITTMMHDHADRRRSYELLAQAFELG